MSKLWQVIFIWFHWSWQIHEVVQIHRIVLGLSVLDIKLGNVTCIIFLQYIEKFEWIYNLKNALISLTNSNSHVYPLRWYLNWFILGGEHWAFLQNGYFRISLYNVHLVAPIVHLVWNNVFGPALRCSCFLHSHKKKMIAFETNNFFLLECLFCTKKIAIFTTCLHQMQFGVCKQLPQVFLLVQSASIAMDLLFASSVE